MKLFSQDVYDIYVVIAIFASAMEPNNPQFSSSKDGVRYDIIYLEVLFQKLTIELLKLQTKGDEMEFKTNCLDVLEKIRRELK